MRDRFNRDLYYRTPFIISLVIGGFLVPIFMLVGGKLTPKGYFVALPQPVAPSACQPGIPPPVVSVRGHPSQRFYDGDLVGPEGLRPHVWRSFANGPVQVIYVEGEREQQVAEVYRAIDELQAIDRNLTIALITPRMRRDPCLVIRIRNTRK